LLFVDGFYTEKSTSAAQAFGFETFSERHTMETLFILAAVWGIGLPVAVVYLLISNASLKQRMTAIEAKDTKVGLNPTPTTIQAAALQTAQRQAVQAATPDTIKNSPPDDSLPQAPTPPHASKSVKPPQTPPQTFVLNNDKFRALTTWLMGNWFYVVSAASLALAGIFLVLYGMEQGLLPPVVRIIAAIVFGATLIGAGEYIRRRFGDDEDRSTAYLPSTFSGAGIVTLFGAVLSARFLYDFIGPEIALLGLALVACIALVFGWFYGPLLAAIGVIGAMVAPFIIDGSSDTPAFLLIYFALISIVGLAIDTLRRWAWVSVLSLVLGFGAGMLLVLGSSADVAPYFIMYCAILALAAIAVPVRNHMPDHTGVPLSFPLLARFKNTTWPEFPTRLAGGSIIAASGLILFVGLDIARPDVFWTANMVLAGFVLALLIWARRAPALTDLSAVPATALIAITAGGTDIWTTAVRSSELPDANTPVMVSILIAIGLGVSAAAAWRSFREGPAKLFFAIFAALFAPTLAIALEVFWAPATTIGMYAWALHAMAIAALMVVLAERFARKDGPEDRQRLSVVALSALACIAFGIVIMFSTAALTTALSITLVAAAWLDRKFNLPLMGLYILAGVTTIGYRLVIDPGIGWATGAPMPEMLLSHGGAVLAFAISWMLVRSAKRPKSEIILESAVFSSVGILLSLLIMRSVVTLGGDAALESHWSLGIGATLWSILGLAQLRRLDAGGTLASVRKGLSILFLGIATVQLTVIVFVLNPLFDITNTLVLGPAVLNTLIPAYLLPAAVFAFGAWWLRGLYKPLRLGFAAVSAALFAVWLGMTIRHFWRGATGMILPDIGQAELYSYTFVLLVLGAGLFYQSLARANATLRKAGLLVIGLAVAKVFMIDISGLGGLIRVFSLLFLGLALAGLAWLNRWATGRISPQETLKDDSL
jgi:uncharacterized membrane protein